jgi:hypothetical protein
MPNHCYQQVEIYGPRFLVKELYDNLSKEEPQFCQLIKPMAFEQWLAPKTRSQNGYTIAGWYDWRVNNWGTKWDVVDVQFTNPLYLHDDEPDTGDPWTMNASFSFNCWTAWSPPIPVWDALVGMGLSVDADYQDEGMMFEGRYVNGEDKCWEPDLDEEEEDA